MFSTSKASFISPTRRLIISSRPNVYLLMMSAASPGHPMFNLPGPLGPHFRNGWGSTLKSTTRIQWGDLSLAYGTAALCSAAPGHNPLHSGKAKSML